MNKFLKLSLTIVALTTLLAIFLDYSYTLIYKQSNSRGKIDKVYNSEPTTYDVVILGSSRANNHFVAPLFKKQGLKVFNYGMSGSHLFEADLLLKILLERKFKIKTVLIEVDLSLSNDKRADAVASKFLPYIHDSAVIRSHFESETDFNYLYYIPFYRYIVYDSQIGFREAYKTISKEPSSLLQNSGYYPLDNKKKRKMQNDITNLVPLPNNKYYEDIKQLCKNNAIRLIPIMTPMCENTKGLAYFDKVKKAYPEIYNYEENLQRS